MTFDDLDYLEQRARAALELAQAAQHPAAVRAHYAMASVYLSRLYPVDSEGSQPQNGTSGPVS